MPGSEGGPIGAFKKRMSFGNKLTSKFGRHKNKESKDSEAKPSVNSNASTASEPSNASNASNASTLVSETPTTTSTAPSMPPTTEKYCTLRLSDDLAITIGDAFEPNPKSTLDDAHDFEYGPIRWPKFLRLVLLFPAIKEGEPLETLIFHADLHEVPFQMLKYEKGHEMVNMHVNGLKKLVHEGLYDALHKVRDRAKGRAFTVLWVDELCVNHSDEREIDAHTRLKRDIVAACTGKTAVDAAFNANFKRGRRGRRSGEAERGEASGANGLLTPRQDRPRKPSNASDLDGSFEIQGSRFQSRAQSVASMRTTERIRADSDDESTDEDHEHDHNADDTDSDASHHYEKRRRPSDPNGKRPAKGSPGHRRDGSAHRSKRHHEEEPKNPKISISFDAPKPPKNDAADEHYHVMKSQPLGSDG